MNYNYLPGVGLALFGVLIASISQIMLKKSAQQEHSTRIADYINFLVIGGYGLLLFTTIISVWSLRFIPVTLAAALESTGQIFVPVLSLFFLKECISGQKLFGMLFIVIGLFIYFF